MAHSAVAQQAVPPCQPPQSDEYLLLVLSRTWENHQQVQRTLPQQSQARLCRYLDDTVTRIGGFWRAEDANDWARYVNEIVGFSAYVVRPTSAPSPLPPTPPPNNSQGYTPQALGEGYAVLVDYFDRPEVAAEVQQLLGRDVGLAAYGQRPYLLAVYTTNEQAANSILRQLSDRGFWSMVVDSRRVTLLRPAVQF
jgi:hypothetical protein